MSLTVTDVTVEAGSTDIPVNITTSLPAGTNVLGHVIADSGSTVAVTALPSIPAGANAIGSVSVSNFPATQPVSGTVTANQGTAAAPSGSWSVEVTDGTNVIGTSAHPIQTISAVASTSTVTQVVASANTNTVLLAANPNRKRAILFFPKGNATTFVKLGTTASATSWTYIVIGNDSVIESADWNGEIDYFGQAQTINVTELV